MNDCDAIVFRGRRVKSGCCEVELVIQSEYFSSSSLDD